MKARNLQMSNIANAIAYVDVALRTTDVEGLPHYDLIAMGIRQEQLSFREVIGIIRETVRNDTDLYNKDVILIEIQSDEFLTYLKNKFQIVRKSEPMNTSNTKLISA